MPASCSCSSCCLLGRSGCSGCSCTGQTAPGRVACRAVACQGCAFTGRSARASPQSGRTSGRPGGRLLLLRRQGWQGGRVWDGTWLRRQCRRHVAGGGGGGGGGGGRVEAERPRDAGMAGGFIDATCSVFGGSRALAWGLGVSQRQKAGSRPPLIPASLPLRIAAPADRAPLKQANGGAPLEPQAPHPRFWVVQTRSLNVLPAPPSLPAMSCSRGAGLGS